MTKPPAERSSPAPVPPDKAPGTGKPPVALVPPSDKKKPDAIVGEGLDFDLCGR